MGEPHPWQQVLQMIVGSWVSRAIYVAAKRRIAARLKDGPRAAEELAAAVDVPPRPLHRLLRALACPTARADGKPACQFRAGAGT